MPKYKNQKSQVKKKLNKIKRRRNPKLATSPIDELTELQIMYSNFIDFKNKSYSLISATNNTQQRTNYMHLIRSIERSIDLVTSLIENR